MALGSKNPIITAASIAFGVIIGWLLGIQGAIGHLAEFLKQTFHSQEGTFVDGFITTTVLFCVGPMTLLGCMQDGLEGKSELLSLKSTLDGFGAFFFAVGFGSGVLATALSVLFIQGAITLAASRLRRLAENEPLMNEISGVGGVMLLGTAFGLLNFGNLQIANYLPALFVCPAIYFLVSKLSSPKLSSPSERPT